VITGFNTDVEHDGVVYHVQTEDKGLESPIILSLVYVGGAILASKRSPYHDLLGEGFDAAALGERLQRQHKLICAAITAGRIEDLKRLNRGDSQENGPRGKRARRGDAARPAPEAAPPAAPPSADVILQEPSPVADSAAVPPEVAAQAPPPPRVEAMEETTAEAVPVEAVVIRQEAEAAETTAAGQPAAPAPPAETPAEEQELIPVEIVGALHVNLLEERDYRAGEIVTLRVRVSRGHIESREAVADATVTVKILGTEFRPLILTSKTDQDGVAVIHAWLPRFTSGRAAILVRATSDGYSAELRRAVRHS
jgi:hypothetical protein